MTRGIVVDPVADEELEPTSAKPGSKPESSQNEEQQDLPELPEKFKGKSLEDIVEMYTNLESETGRLRNEVGEVRAEARTWRQLSEDLGKTRQEEPKKPSVPDIDGDSLLRDPVNAISTIVSGVLEEKLGPIVQETTTLKQNTELVQFEKDFPNYVEEANSPEFQEFVTGSERRLRLAQQAIDKSDVSAMRELMEDWTERKNLVASLTKQPPSGDESEEESTPPPTGVNGARQAATESPGNGGTTRSGKVFHQSDVIKTLLNNPDKYYSASYQEELLSAMREGRYKK